MADLNEQIHIEDHTLGMTQEEKDAGPPAPGEVVSPQETFSYFAHMYIKYLQIFKRLEESYDNMVHPQKRIDVKDVLETTMTRLVQLRHMLVYDDERATKRREKREERGESVSESVSERPGEKRGSKKRACVWAFESVYFAGERWGRRVGPQLGPAAYQHNGGCMANTQTCSPAALQQFLTITPHTPFLATSPGIGIARSTPTWTTTRGNRSRGSTFTWTTSSWT